MIVVATLCGLVLLGALLRRDHLRLRRQLDTLERAVERVDDRLVSWEGALLSPDVQRHMAAIDQLRRRRRIAARSIDATIESLRLAYDEPILRHHEAIQKLLRP